MMSYLEAIILGLIQGLTEFLPVSSSGHLELVKAFFGNQILPKESMAFTVILHFATALSTLVIFRKDFFFIVKGLCTAKYDEQTKFTLKIMISMIPAIVVGLVFEESLDFFFSGKIIFVAIMLLITAGLLLLADAAKDTYKSLGFLQTFVIGIAQAIAILPGISRSGATIATAVLLKIDRVQAARFSFLMVVPLIFGKIAKDILGGGIHWQGISILPIFLGFVAAFISGLFACRWMMALVKKSRLYYFAIYCMIVGVVALCRFL